MLLECCQSEEQFFASTEIWELFISVDESEMLLQLTTTMCEINDNFVV